MSTWYRLHAAKARKGLIFVIAPLGLMTLSFSVFLFASPETVERLGREDGVFETIGALFFLLSAGCFLWLFFRSAEGNDLFVLKTRRNGFYLLLALLLFFGFGEEISWGQRVFGFQTPQILEQENVQGEINIHNLRVFHGLTEEGKRKQGLSAMMSGARLFSLFWLGFCVLVPVLNRFSKRLSRVFKRMNLPIVSLAIGALFIVNYGLAKALAIRDSRGLGDELTEIKETGFAMLFLVVSTSLIVSCVEKRRG